jgi:subtilisin family serine protease
MTRAVILFLSLAVAGSSAFAQIIPGEYIVEFKGDPAARIAAARHTRLSDSGVSALRLQVRAGQLAVENAVLASGGRVLMHYDTILNGMAVSMPDSAVAQLRSNPVVLSITPVQQIHKILDAAVKVHRITDAWNAINGGAPHAGAGIKIAIIDTGIDVTHPGFQGFSTPVPSGFPIACDYAVDSQGNLGATCASNSAEVANTNNKVIVSRDYTGDGGGDKDGHGTGVAMIAGGMTNNAVFDILLYDGFTLLPVTLDPLTGVAPGAWLGSYKVIGTHSSSAGMLLAAEDAANDGMQVLNLSVGATSINAEDEIGGPIAHAISNLVAAGVVVCAAGDDGYSNDLGIQAPSTIVTPANAPDALAVGAIGNGRQFDYSVTVSGLPPAEAAVPDILFDLNAPDLADPVNGPLVDIAKKLDPTGLACTNLPLNSLSGAVVLIHAGACDPDTQLNNLTNAGAIAAVIVSDFPGYPYPLQLTTAILPALMVSQSDGQKIQAAADSGGASAYLDFGATTPFPADPNTIAYYSPAGPTVAGNIKPDMMAVGGQWIDWINDQAMYDDSLNSYYYTGAQVLTAISAAGAANQGNNDPYQIASGTSFSSPFVAGSAAILMNARPGLTAQQYKSLLVNSSPLLTVCDDASPPTYGICFDGNIPLQALVQNVGSGKLDLLGSLRNDLAASPVSINFRTAPASTVNYTQTVPVTFTNVGASADSFTVSVNQVDGTIVPTVDTPSFSLAPGASKLINVTITAPTLTAGWYHDGNISVTSTKTGITSNLGYWFGVPGTDVFDIVLLNQNDLGQYFAPRSKVTMFVRYTDVIGMPVAAAAPTVTVPGTAGKVLNIAPAGDVPGTWEIDVQLDSGRAYGGDEFDVTFGTLPPLQVFLYIN